MLHLQHFLQSCPVRMWQGPCGENQVKMRCFYSETAGFAIQIQCLCVLKRLLPDLSFNGIMKRSY